MYHKCMISWETTRLPLRRPVLRLMDLVTTMQNSAKSTEIAELDADLWQRFAIDSSPKVLRMVITCIHTDSFDAFTELHEWSVKLAIQVASACDDVLANVYAFMDAETGMLQDTGFSALCLWHTVILSFDLVFFCCQGLRFNDVLRLLLNQPLSCFRADNQLIDLDLCLQWIR